MIKVINGKKTINSNHRINDVDSGTFTEINNQYQAIIDYSISYPTSGGIATIRISSITFKAIGSSNWYPNITLSDTQLYLEKYLDIDVDKHLSIRHQVCSERSHCQIDTRNNKVTTLYTNLQYNFNYDCIKGNRLYISAGCFGGLYVNSTGNDVLALLIGCGTKSHEIWYGTPDYCVINLPPTQSVCVKRNSIWKRAFAWIKILGKWKRCVVWKKINGIWKKGS